MGNNTMAISEIGKPSLALVSGASRGIDRAIARGFALEGIGVATVSRTLRPGDGEVCGSLEDDVGLITDSGGDASAFAVDSLSPNRRTTAEHAGNSTARRRLLAVRSCWTGGHPRTRKRDFLPPYWRINPPGAVPENLTMPAKELAAKKGRE